MLSRLGASDRTNEGFALEMNIVLRNGSVFALQSARAFFPVFFFIASGNRDSPLRGFSVNKPLKSRDHLFKKGSASCESYECWTTVSLTGI